MNQRKCPREQEETLNDIAQGGQGKRLRKNDGSQNEGRKAGRDRRRPDLIIPLQEDYPRWHSRPKLEQTLVTEVIAPRSLGGMTLSRFVALRRNFAC